MKISMTGRKFVVVTDESAEYEFRQPSVRKLNKLNAELQEQVKNPERSVEALAVFVGGLMFGWKNVATDEADVAKLFGIDIAQGESTELPFRPGLLGDVVTVGDLNQMFNLVMEAVNPKPSPNFESPAPSPAGSSAAIAQAANAVSLPTASSATSSTTSPATSAAGPAAPSAAASAA